VRRLGQTAPRRHRRLLIGGSLLVLLASVTTLALASRRIKAEEAAFSAPPAARCYPSTLNRSAVLPGTPLAVTPLPDSYDALPQTQVSLLGAPVSALSKVTVKGSESGSHSGHLAAYSQGDGASFLPAKPFESGETVTVRGLLDTASGVTPFAFHFAVAREDVLAHTKSSHPSRDYNEKQHFRSRPDLEPPGVVVSGRSSSSAPGYVFSAPYNGPGQAGPMIFDNNGSLIWFDPLPPETEAANLQVQELGGQPVLTWWQGYIPPQGFGKGEEVIADSSYEVIGRVHAGNGDKVDLHDFQITPQGTALFTAFQPIDCNLSTLGGPSGGAVTDSLIQEVDLKTGLVRREWHSLDHIAMGDSYSTAVTTSTHTPFDFFHLNTIDLASATTTVISARNTWSLYELNALTGQVQRSIGGKHSTVKQLGGSHTAYQHDATTRSDGTITVFDNGGVPKVHPQSRGLVLRIDRQANTESVVAQYEHRPALSSGSQGNIQTLPGGNLFLGWGSEPYFSEYSPSGNQLFDAHFHGSYQAYRGYRFSWRGAPPGSPSIAVSSSPKRTTVYASWNGDTRTVTWRVLAGTTSGGLAPVASAARTGFETQVPTPARARYVAVQALDATGAVIGTSRTTGG
jgi:hypothetical protein